MTSPVTIDKELKDWTFDELCKWAAWEVVQGMFSEKSLNSTMHYVLDVTLRWKAEK